MADLLDYALTTVADVKESLGITDSSQDNLIRRKINQATLYIESYCSLPEDHHFKQTTYTQEEYDGTRSNTIVLKMRPVITLFSLQRRDGYDNSDSWDDVESESYFIDKASGVVELNFDTSRGWNSYRATYTAGYSTIPFDLAEACASLASFYVSNSSNSSGAAVKKKQEGQRSIEYFDPSSGSSSNGSSVIEQLGLDDVLTRYKRMSLADSL